MAAFDFPSSPSVNQTYTANGVTWKWNGTMWMRVSGAGYLEKIEEGNSKVEVDDSGSGNITATTDGTERLRITSGGDVSIGGLASPRAKLDIEDAGTSKDVILRVSADDNNPYALVVANDTFNTTSNRGFAFWVGGDKVHHIEARTSTTNSENEIMISAGDAISFRTNVSSERLRIDSNGNIGIGLNNPGRQLTLSHASQAEIGLLSGADTSGGLIYQNASEQKLLIANRESDGHISFQTGGVNERLRITSAGGHRIQCDESWHAANLSECNTDKLALNINQTRQGQTKGIALGCVGSGSGATGIQAYDTSDNSANTLELNPFGGNLLYGDTASDLSGDHKFIAVGAKHAFQYNGDAGTYLSVILGAANGTVDLEADARSGNYPDLRFITTNDEQLRVLAAGHIWKKNDGALWHGTPDINDFSNANRSNYNKVSIRAGDPNDGTSPTNDNSAIKIYPAGNRGATVGTLSGGIAWQHLDPDNGSWDTAYGAGSQIWMGSAIHDTPGQERSRFNLWMNSGTTGNSQPGNLAIEAYPNGVVRHPKVPAFMVRNTNNANAFSADARATWNTQLLNNGSHFDMTNNVFTAPIDGIYNFTCMMLSNAGTRLFHSFRVNNTIVEGTRSEGHAVSGSYATYTITMTYSLSASDYVDVYVRNNNAYGGVYTNFNGFLVG